MRSIPVVDESSIALARSYDGIADFLLLDSYKSGDRQIGALGVTHSWELDCRIIESVRIPVIIAGGLGPENVREAIRSARPAGVDSKTKTDKSDGSHTKDLQKVSAFVVATRSLDQGTITQPRESC
jgi:phosphoribosylanthranilate isomerase